MKKNLIAASILAAMMATNVAYAQVDVPPPGSDPTKPVEPVPISELEQKVDNLRTDFIDERYRAQTADGELDTRITNESTRAQSAEAGLDNRITSETSRATKAEAVLDSRINSETARAMSAENVLDTKINSETNRAVAVETNLGNRISSETTRATAAEAGLGNRISSETQRAQAAEAAITMEARQIGAMAMSAAAAAGASPVGDKKSAITAAVGTYGGYSAVTIGAVRMINHRTKMYGSVTSANGGTVGAAVGVSFSF